MEQDPLWGVFVGTVFVGTLALWVTLTRVASALERIAKALEAPR